MALLDVTLLQASDADMSNDAPAGEDVNAPAAETSTLAAGDVRPTLKSNSVSSPQGACVTRVNSDVTHLSVSARLCMYLYVSVVQYQVKGFVSFNGSSSRACAHAPCVLLLVTSCTHAHPV